MARAERVRANTNSNRTFITSVTHRKSFVIMWKITSFAQKSAVGTCHVASSLEVNRGQPFETEIKCHKESKI